MEKRRLTPSSLVVEVSEEDRHGHVYMYEYKLNRSVRKQWDRHELQPL